jgi:hypothetical protein
MAKTQNLSLNPTKISGTCGRLMCCLKYEQDAYEDLIRNAPKAESFVDTPEGRGTVTEVDLLRQRVKVRLEDEPETIISCANDEIAILRSGKAKKADPPIPADLAPISGNGKKAQKKVEEAPLPLETIRFRYREETLVEDATEEASVQQPQDESKKSQRRNRKNRPGSKQEQAPKAQPVKEPKPKPEPEEEIEDEVFSTEEKEKKTNFRRRNHYRHRRPKAKEQK